MPRKLRPHPPDPRVRGAMQRGPAPVTVAWSSHCRSSTWTRSHNNSANSPLGNSASRGLRARELVDWGTGALGDSGNRATWETGDRTNGQPGGTRNGANRASDDRETGGPGEPGTWAAVRWGSRAIGAQCAGLRALAHGQPDRADVHAETRPCGKVGTGERGVAETWKRGHGPRVHVGRQVRGHAGRRAGGHAETRPQGHAGTRAPGYAGSRARGIARTFSEHGAVGRC